MRSTARAALRVREIGQMYSSWVGNRTPRAAAGRPRSSRKVRKASSSCLRVGADHAGGEARAQAEGARARVKGEHRHAVGREVADDVEPIGEGHLQHDGRVGVPGFAQEAVELHHASSSPVRCDARGRGPPRLRDARPRHHGQAEPVQGPHRREAHELLGPRAPMTRPTSARAQPLARYRTNGSGSDFATGHSAISRNTKKSRCRAKPGRPPSAYVSSHQLCRLVMPEGVGPGADDDLGLAGAGAQQQAAAGDLQAAAPSGPGADRPRALVGLRPGRAASPGGTGAACSDC